jgi:hypothetical protein
LKELAAKLTNASGGNNPSITSITLSSAYIEQNYSNPSTFNTLICYHLPAKTKNVQVVVTNIKGQLIRTVTLNDRGDGQITINAATLAGGIYNYSFWFGGKEVDTKSLVVAEVKAKANIDSRLSSPTDHSQT